MYLLAYYLPYNTIKEESKSSRYEIRQNKNINNNTNNNSENNWL